MLNPDDTRLIFLYKKFLAKTAAPDELGELYKLLSTVEGEARLSDLLEADFQLTDIHDPQLDETRSDQIFTDILAEKQRPVRSSRKLWSRLAGAAVIAGLVIGVAILGEQILKKDVKPNLSLTSHDIAPGRTGATLTLSNGRKIALATVNYGQLVNESGVKISKTPDGSLFYEVNDNGTAAPTEQNLLSTAMGETYQVKLPDGSLVRLNAASSLKYPISFLSSNDRRVELHGEAYFEIAKDTKHPFIVVTDRQEVRVVGTHFNIKAYDSEKEFTTTLAEGSVRVSYRAAAWSDHGKVGYRDDVTLIPGQQSVLMGEAINIREADMEASLAWTNGNFVFNEQSIQKIMQDISRWYNIDVIYQGAIPAGKFSGNVSRTKNISQILMALEATKLVHFRIDERRVYVSK